MYNLEKVLRLYSDLEKLFSLLRVLENLLVMSWSFIATINFLRILDIFSLEISLFKKAFADPVSSIKCRLHTVDCRLQTRGKMQTEEIKCRLETRAKMQTAVFSLNCVTFSIIES